MLASPCGLVLSGAFAFGLLRCLREHVGGGAVSTAFGLLGKGCSDVVGLLVKTLVERNPGEGVGGFDVVPVEDQ
jgi:hypothetical protein